MMHAFSQHEARLRYPEIDAFKGASIIGMAVYHFLYDLHYFFGISQPFFSLPNQTGRVIGSCFLLMTGMCFSISVSRSSQEGRFKKAVKRFLMLSGYAMCISIVTRIFIGDAYVRFGMLHLLAVSSLLHPLFAHQTKASLITASLVFFLAAYPLGIDGGGANLFFLGIAPPAFDSVDHYPIIPWFGMTLVGISLGNAMYGSRSSQLQMRLSKLRYPQWLLWFGKHSLPVYLVHQPVLLAVLYAIL